MSEYFLAASLVALRNEINQRWPNRDKDSDGWIGDASHQARQSDHNPDWSAPGIRRGVVRAIDIDKDGIDVDQLIAAVVREPRVAYVIWNRHIASATDDGRPWDWEPYDGKNPHTQHVHISILHTAAAETDTSTWFDAARPNLTIALAAIQRAARGEQVTDSYEADCRQFLAWARKRRIITPQTEQAWDKTREPRHLFDAIRNVQRAEHLVVDGIFGPATARTMKPYGYTPIGLDGRPL